MTIVRVCLNIGNWKFDTMMVKPASKHEIDQKLCEIIVAFARSRQSWSLLRAHPCTSDLSVFWVEQKSSPHKMSHIYQISVMFVHVARIFKRRSPPQATHVWGTPFHVHFQGRHDCLDCFIPCLTLVSYLPSTRYRSGRRFKKNKKNCCMTW